MTKCMIDEGVERMMGERGMARSRRKRIVSPGKIDRIIFQLRRVSHAL